MKLWFIIATVYVTYFDWLSQMIILSQYWSLMFQALFFETAKISSSLKPKPPLRILTKLSLPWNPLSSLQKVTRGLSTEKCFFKHGKFSNKSSFVRTCYWHVRCCCCCWWCCCCWSGSPRLSCCRLFYNPRNQFSICELYNQLTQAPCVTQKFSCSICCTLLKFEYWIFWMLHNLIHVLAKPGWLSLLWSRLF